MIKAGRFSRQQLWIISLLLVVIFVVFILPNLVTEPATKNDSMQTSVAVNNKDLPPSLIAEKTRYRQQSQSLLASILALRDQLMVQSVNQWAEAQFNNAMALVTEGDEQYSFGKYQPSLDSYQRAFSDLQELEILAADTLEQSLEEATQAIVRADTADIALVRGATSLALAIAPEDSRVKDLNKLAQGFSELVEALSQGDRKFEKQQYQLAEDFYQSALAIVPEHQRAKDSLRKTQIAIDENNFIRLMSEGYTLLNNALDNALNNSGLDSSNYENSTYDNSVYDVALEKFTQAQAIYGSYSNSVTSTVSAESEKTTERLESVKQAIAQLNNQRSQQAIKQQLIAAADFEKQEQWQQAQAIYQRLLNTDNSLSDVKTKQIKATVRAKLDKEIVSVLKDPLKLADQNAYADAQRILNDAKGINNPQAKLRGQIEQLSSVIERSQIPVEVLLLSDQQTDVTLFRVAKLGAFQERRVQLTPGRYIIAGSRKGYRDVRIELTVMATEEIGPVQISCTERI